MRTFIALLVTISSLAFAQTEQPKQQTPKPQVVTFGDHEVDGVRELPTNTYVLVHTKTKFDSLIKMRASFNDKLAASVDSL